MWAVVDDFRVFPDFGRDRRGSSAVVGDPWCLWTILGFDACDFGLCAGFVGNSYPVLRQKVAQKSTKCMVNVDKMRFLRAVGGGGNHVTGGYLFATSACCCRGERGAHQGVPEPGFRRKRSRRCRSRGRYRGPPLALRMTAKTYNGKDEQRQGQTTARTRSRSPSGMTTKKTTATAKPKKQRQRQNKRQRQRRRQR